jgi:hypothetical protein
VKITNVKSNHARAEELERLPMEEDEAEDDTDTPDPEIDEDVEADEADDTESKEARPHLGSRDNFWGG